MESDASSADEKPSIWSQISSTILMMVSTRSSDSETSVVVVICQAPHLRKSAPANLAALRQPFAQQPTYNRIVGGVGGGASKCDCHWGPSHLPSRQVSPNAKTLKVPVPSRTPG